MSSFVLLETATVAEPGRKHKLWIVDGVIAATGENPDFTGKHEGAAHPTMTNHPGLSRTDFTALDTKGLFASPGLIDLQMNGGPQCDLWQGPSKEELREMRLELAHCGVTAFLPTLITDSIENLQRNIAFLSAEGASREPEAQVEPLSRMLGIHLEGPCLSPAKPGVHPREHIAPLTTAVLERLLRPEIALVTAALEEDQSGEAQALLNARGVVTSLGHSNATYEQAERAIERGARLLTHVFNALPPLHHRNPGACGAALLNHHITCCLIADGLHVSAQMCDLVYRLKGTDKTILVTDRAHIGTSQGGLVGSSITLDQAVKNMVDWGICSLEAAIEMASYNPARAIGLSHKLGRIQPGYFADLAFFDKEHKVQMSMVGGTMVQQPANSAK